MVKMVGGPVAPKSLSVGKAKLGSQGIFDELYDIEP